MIALFIISLLGITALLAEILNFRKLLPAITLLGILAAMVAAIAEWNSPVSIPAFNNMLVFDHYALAFSVSLCLITFLWFIMAHHYHKTETAQADHYALILFSLAGAIVMTGFGNMVMLFLGLEILSIPLYILAGSRKTDLSSNEAAFKYFLLGAFSAGFLLFGITLVYGATGTFELSQMNMFITLHANEMPAFFYAGIILIVSGLAFKVSAAPFHFWAPDVYQGSPNMITAFMSTIVKIAAFAAFFRLFSTCFAIVESSWSQVVWIIAVVTLLLGNITAIQQASFKRMLAYSGISHAGYLLLAILAINAHAAGSIFLYTLAYSIATIAAFAVLEEVYKLKGNDSIASFNGLAKRNPLLAFTLTISMLSLAGIPPTAGFFAKYYIFNTALSNGYLWLVIIAVIASLIGVYYYFKLIIAAWFKPADDETLIQLGIPYKILLALTILLTLALGLFPGYILNLF
jgi:NADH-quinone oxidoreductase subunit N